MATSASSMVILEFSSCGFDCVDAAGITGSVDGGGGSGIVSVVVVIVVVGMIGGDVGCGVVCCCGDGGD